MNGRVIAVQVKDGHVVEQAAQIVDALGGLQSQAIVFKKAGTQGLGRDGIEEIDVPEDKDNDSKVKNFILDYMVQNKLQGFLHIIETGVRVLKDPREFIESVESTMSSLDYSIYFSTVTDPCNYLFKKFNPRLSLDIDDEEIKSKLKLPSKLSFTSHANLCWTIYDFNKIGQSPQKYDERFSIAMYQIIEYLARRRSTREEGQLYYMNQYLSVSDEIGVFTVDESADASKIDAQKMQKEDQLFREMNVEFSPDNNLDIVLDTFYQKVKQKIA